MDLSAPWIPSIDGKACAPCALYDGVVMEDTRPNAREHSDWAQENLESRLGKTPAFREALWEGILALWRLRLQEEKGVHDVSWRNLVSAWLVRGRWLGGETGADNRVFGAVPSQGPMLALEHPAVQGRRGLWKGATNSKASS